MAAAVEAPRRWQVQTMEVRERKKILSSMQKRIDDLCMAIKQQDMSDEADREEKKAKLEEERAALVRESWDVAREIKTPDYSDMTEAERVEEAERLRQEELEEARRLEMAGDTDGSLFKQYEARITDLDPKQGGEYYNRMLTFPPFDLDEESPLAAMRFTYKNFENGHIFLACDAVNILSVTIACSDVGFPIEVYGTVIARDSTDYKCVYLFRRDRDEGQLITSKDEPLILTGPKRGLALLDDNYVETDLKIKDDQGQDRELSKGLLEIDGIGGPDKCRVETESIATRLSTVDVLYAVVRDAVEGTIAIRVVKGGFYGTITAHTTNIQKRIVLYDSKVAGAMTRHGVIELLQPVVSVNTRDMLIIDTETSAGKSARLKFTPRRNRGERVVITLGTTVVRVKVAWSIMDP